MNQAICSSAHIAFLRRLAAPVALASALVVTPYSALATGSGTATGGTASAEEPAPEFTEEFLLNTEHVDRGRDIWKKRCKFCHGNSAYPGKAPKLTPSRYEPMFVYKRVTKGFRGMPGWAHEFDQLERMSVTAFIMHKSFSQK